MLFGRFELNSAQAKMFEAVGKDKALERQLGYAFNVEKIYRENLDDGKLCEQATRGRVIGMSGLFIFLSSFLSLI